jgi:hypothetical protein
VLWLGSAALWLLPANSSPDGVEQALQQAPSGTAWLSGLQSAAAGIAGGHGLEIAIAAACLSAGIGVAALLNRWVWAELALAVGVALVYLVLGQGLGGMFTGSGTDPGTGPLWMLLAVAVYGSSRRGKKSSAARS